MKALFSLTKKTNILIYAGSIPLIGTSFVNNKKIIPKSQLRNYTV